MPGAARICNSLALHLGTRLVAIGSTVKNAGNVRAVAPVRMKVAASNVDSDADDTPSSTHIPPGAIILSAAACDAPPTDSMI